MAEQADSGRSFQRELLYVLYMYLHDADRHSSLMAFEINPIYTNLGSPLLAKIITSVGDDRHLITLICRARQLDLE